MDNLVEQLRKGANRLGFAIDDEVVAVEVQQLLRSAADRVEKLDATLLAISAIRDSIVGAQGFNISEHAYPLVAALNNAGYTGVGYEIAHANLGTLIERISTSEACVAKLEAALVQVNALLRINDDHANNVKHARHVLARVIDGDANG